MDLGGPSGVKELLERVYLKKLKAEEVVVRPRCLRLRA